MPEEHSEFWLVLDAPSGFYDLSTDGYEEDATDDFFQRSHPEHEREEPPLLRCLLDQLSLQHSSPVPTMRVGSPASTALPFVHMDTDGVQRSRLSTAHGSCGNPGYSIGRCHKGSCRTEVGRSTYVAPSADGSGGKNSGSGSQLSVHHEHKKRSVSRAGLQTPEARQVDNCARGRRILSPAPAEPATTSAAPRAPSGAGATACPRHEDREAHDVLTELQLHNQRVVQAGVQAARDRVQARSAKRGVPTSEGCNSAAPPSAKPGSSSSRSMAVKRVEDCSDIPKLTPRPGKKSGTKACATWAGVRQSLPAVTSQAGGKQAEVLPQPPQNVRPGLPPAPPLTIAVTTQPFCSASAFSAEALLPDLELELRQLEASSRAPIESPQPLTESPGFPMESQPQATELPASLCGSPSMMLESPQPFSEPAPSAEQQAADQLPSVREGPSTAAFDDLPEEFFCPITKRLMRDPVSTVDGQVFERAAIERWLRRHSTNPLSGEPLSSTLLIPNLPIARLITNLPSSRVAAASKGCTDQGHSRVVSAPEPRVASAQGASSRRRSLSLGIPAAAASSPVRSGRQTASSSPFITADVRSRRQLQNEAAKESKHGCIPASAVGSSCSCGAPFAFVPVAETQPEGGMPDSRDEKVSTAVVPKAEIFTFAAAPATPAPAPARSQRTIAKRTAAVLDACPASQQGVRSRREMLEAWQKERERKKQAEKSGKKVLSAIGGHNSRVNAAPARRPAARVETTGTKAKAPAASDTEEGDHLMDLLRSHNAKFDSPKRLHEQRTSSVAAMRAWEKTSGKTYATMSVEERILANNEIMRAMQTTTGCKATSS